MDTATEQLVKNAMGTFVRWLLILAAGILVKKGIISTTQSDVYVQQALPVVIGAAMALLALVWGILQKKHSQDKVLKALNAPAGTSLEQLEKKI